MLAHNSTATLTDVECNLHYAAMTDHIRAAHMLYQNETLSWSVVMLCHATGLDGAAKNDPAADDDYSVSSPPPSSSSPSATNNTIITMPIAIKRLASSPSSPAVAYVICWHHYTSSYGTQGPG